MSDTDLWAVLGGALNLAAALVRLTGGFLGRSRRRSAACDAAGTGERGI